MRVGEFTNNDSKQGYAISDILNGINAKGRDNARHPMQWNGKNQSGFTDGTPWLPVNPNYLEINVELAKQDERSIYATYQQLIKLRKRNAIIRQADLKMYQQVIKM